MKDCAAFYLYCLLAIVAIVGVIAILPEAVVAAIWVVIEVARVMLLLSIVGYWLVELFSKKREPSFA